MAESFFRRRSPRGMLVLASACAAWAIGGEALAQGAGGGQAGPIDYPIPAMAGQAYSPIGEVSLSETKSGHIGGAIRPRLAGAECDRSSGWRATPAHPCSATGACELDCSILRKIEAHGEDAVRRIRQRGRGSPVGSS